MSRICIALTTAQKHKRTKRSDEINKLKFIKLRSLFASSLFSVRSTCNPIEWQMTHNPIEIIAMETQAKKKKRSHWVDHWFSHENRWIATTEICGFQCHWYDACVMPRQHIHYTYHQRFIWSIRSKSKLKMTLTMAHAAMMLMITFFPSHNLWLFFRVFFSFSRLSS